MLKNKHIEQCLLQDGFAIVGKLNEDELAHLTTTIDAYLPETAITDFYYSLLTHTPAENINIMQSQNEILQDFFYHNFNNIRTVTSSFLVKPPMQSELFLHQDWCYTNEVKHNAYNVWIPLQDVDIHNGALFFLPGSHNWFQNFRSGAYDTARISSANPDIAKKVVTVSLKKGEVILFHPALFHGSHPNRTKQNRVIAATTVMDKDAPFLYYHAKNTGFTNVYSLPDSYFVTNLAPLTIGQQPEATIIETLPYHHTLITVDLVVQKLNLTLQDQ